MTERSKEKHINVVGIGLAKHSFHLFAVDASGQQVVSKKLSRGRLGAFVANLPPCTVAMEACGSAHRSLQATKVLRLSDRLCRSGGRPDLLLASRPPLRPRADAGPDPSSSEDRAAAGPLGPTFDPSADGP